MWLLEGPFDGEESGAVNFRKTKLLRTTKDYTFGRKGTGLTVNSKKISGEHGAFQVGEFITEDPSATPTLTFKSLKKPFQLNRGEGSRDIAGEHVQELQDGDEIVVVNIVHIKVRWVRVCCYSSTPSGLQSECTSLGINLTFQPSAEVTHHLTPTLTLAASLAASLISSAQLVKPEWLQDVVRLGDGAHTLPVVTLAKYRPKLDANLDRRHQNHNLWDPNEGRLKIFRHFRFLCVGEKAREMIARGEGTLESFDIHMGVDKFRQAIMRGQNKEGKRLVLVGDEVMLGAAVGEDVLKEFGEEAKLSGLSFHSPDALVEAVLDTDTSKLEAQNLKRKARSPSPPPEEAPAPPRPPKRLPRVAASREPSAPPVETPASETPQPPIVRLKRIRRNPIAEVVTGHDDPSAILDAPPDLSDKPPSIAALFEASDPSNLGAMSSASILDSQYNDDAFSVGGSLATGTISQTQMETATTQSKARSTTSLSALREEEEETGPSTFELRATSAAKRKRLGEAGEGGDVVMDDVESHPPSKRRATGTSQAEWIEDEVPAPPNAQPRATSKPPSSRPGGAGASNAKDSSSKTGSKAKASAVASTKRGKKKEDDFDREFNKLKISKPDLAPVEDEPEKEWAVLAEFWGRFGVEGELYDDHGNGGVQGEGFEWDEGGEGEWGGKDTRSERPKIALFSTSGEDITRGESYWKDDKSRPRTQAKPIARRGASAARSPPPSDNEREEEQAPAPMPKKRTQTQTQSRAPSRSRATSRARSIEPAPAPARRTATRKTTAPIIEESDEDEVQESQMTRRSQKSRSQKSEALFLPDDDEDDEDEDGGNGNDGAFKADFDMDIDDDDDDDAETSTLKSKESSYPRRGAPARKPKRPGEG
ncbi:hypothetical protein FA13DRAFT_1781109 [Coprinellus micaceus]|uniref:Nibrin second BRCT domain-containing protein n=1 Tax=Coprinellus micaceus TaxID=71717 RepID=A0A4Y7SBF8_COPMI|nr:hypothetical protein FA13DRAFT_1781109 [Coprinellus micaceus]